MSSPTQITEEKLEEYSNEERIKILTEAIKKRRKLASKSAETSSIGWMKRLGLSDPLFGRQNQFKFFAFAAFLCGFYGLVNATYLSNKNYVVMSWLLLRVMGIMWLISFVSLAVQIVGLIGKDGILPVDSTLESLKEEGNERPFWEYPTLFWWRSDDKAIKALYWAGIACSIGLIFNVFPMINLALCYFIFLSFRTVGREFFALQFDSLVMEASALIFMTHLPSPIMLVHPFPSLSDHIQSNSAIWGCWWLAFRLNFCSGVLKLMTGDKAWGSCTALLYHFWSQPMPSWISYHAFFMGSEKFHILSCFLHFVIEIIVPFGMFFDSTRFYAALGLASLQVGIAVTGNYGTFNWMTIMVSLAGLDDSYFALFAPSVAPEWSFYTIQAAIIKSVCFLLALGIMALTVVPICQISRGIFSPPRVLAKVWREIQGWSLVSYYALFGTMTTYRHEVILEASMDGENWVPYEFKYKPGDPKKAPPFVTGHLPRLDWRMWFLPFDLRRRYESEPPSAWYLMVLYGLLKASPSVLSIMESAPFGTERPTYIRSELWDYHFELPEERKKNGKFWNRRYMGSFCPIVTLRGDRIVLIDPPKRAEQHEELAEASE